MAWASASVVGSPLFGPSVSRGGAQNRGRASTHISSSTRFKRSALTEPLPLQRAGASSEVGAQPRQGRGPYPRYRTHGSTSRARAFALPGHQKVRGSTRGARRCAACLLLLGDHGHELHGRGGVSTSSEAPVCAHLVVVDLAVAVGVHLRDEACGEGMAQQAGKGWTDTHARARRRTWSGPAAQTAHEVRSGPTRRCHPCR